MNDLIENHFAKHYKGWLDYAKFYAKQGGIPGEAEDLLQECLMMCLKKGEDYVLKLLSKKGREDASCETQFDAYLLRVMKLNAISSLAPFRFAMRISLAKDLNIDPFTLDLIDEEYEENPGGKEITLERYREVREVFEVIKPVLTPLEAIVFNCRFFQDSRMKEIAETLGENLQNIYDAYNRVQSFIKTYINTGTLDRNKFYTNGRLKKPRINAKNPQPKNAA